MTQTRNVYRTRDEALNRILADIAKRLDMLEGLRGVISLSGATIEIKDDNGEVTHKIGDFEI